MRRTKTLLMGDLLEEFFKRPYIAEKVAEGKLPDTWREIVGDRAADVTTELRLEKHILYVRIPPFGRTARQRRHHPVSPGSAKKHTLYNIYEKRCSFSRSIFFSMAGRFHSPSPIRPGLI